MQKYGRKNFCFAVCSEYISLAVLQIGPVVLPPPALYSNCVVYGAVFQKGY